MQRPRLGNLHIATFVPNVCMHASRICLHRRTIDVPNQETLTAVSSGELADDLL